MINEERSRRVTGSLAESPIDENWFNERRANQKKSGPETPGRLRMGWPPAYLRSFFWFFCSLGSF